VPAHSGRHCRDRPIRRSMIAILAIKQLRSGASDKSSDNDARQCQMEHDILRRRYPLGLR